MLDNKITTLYHLFSKHRKGKFSVKYQLDSEFLAILFPKENNGLHYQPYVRNENTLSIMLRWFCRMILVKGFNIEKKEGRSYSGSHLHKYFLSILTYLMGFDKSGASLAAAFGVTGVPETYFIDRQGIVRHKITGPVNVQMLADFLSQIRD